MAMRPYNAWLAFLTTGMLGEVSECGDSSPLSLTATGCGAA